MWFPFLRSQRGEGSFTFFANKSLTKRHKPERSSASGKVRRGTGGDEECAREKDVVTRWRVREVMKNPSMERSGDQWAPAAACI